MASVVVVTRLRPGEFEVEIDETNADSAQVVMVDGVPYDGTCRRQTCILGPGAGNTVLPELRRDSGVADDESIIAKPPVADADDVMDRTGSATYRCTERDAAGLGRLYHRSNVDAGADNTITTTYHLIDHW